jgi:hypothetical protein
MNSVQQARAELAECLDELPGLNVTRQLGQTMELPAVVVSLPRLAFEGQNPGEPTQGTFLLALMAPRDEDVAESLTEWVTKVTEQIDRLDSAVVRNADPGTWPSGGTDLPAYLIEVEVALP